MQGSDQIRKSNKRQDKIGALYQQQVNIITQYFIILFAFPYFFNQNLLF